MINCSNPQPTKKFSKKSNQWIYHVACGNKYSKTVAKYSLSTAIAGAVAATGIGSYFAGAAGAVSATFYDDVCSYFQD